MSGSHIFVIVILAMVFAFSTLRSWLKHGNKVPDTSDEAEAMMSKIDALEERIRVLERIVTEHNIDLKQQIDSL